MMGRLALKFEKGAALYLNDTKVEVLTIREPNDFDIKVLWKTGEETYKVSDTKSTWLKDVAKVQSGKSGTRNEVQLVVEADDDIVVMREQLYNDMKGEDYYLFTSNAKHDLRALGLIPDHNFKELAAMVSNSAHVTHPVGSHRYEEFVFNVKDKVVLGVGYYAVDQKDLKHRDTNHAPNSTDVYDECPVCKGEGCHRCDDGEIKIGTHTL